MEDQTSVSSVQNGSSTLSGQWPEWERDFSLKRVLLSYRFPEEKGSDQPKAETTLVSTLFPGLRTHRPAEYMTQISCVAFVSDSNFYCLYNTR